MIRCWCVRAAGWCRLPARWSWRYRWREALAQVQALLAPNRFDPASAKRKFRVAMSDYSAAIFLPRLVRTLRREAPGIDLQIIQASREGMVDGVLNGDIDLAAGVFPDMPAELRTTPLFEEHYTCLVDRASLPHERHARPAHLPVAPPCAPGNARQRHAGNRAGADGDP